MSDDNPIIFYTEGGNVDAFRTIPLCNVPHDSDEDRFDGFEYKRGEDLPLVREMIKNGNYDLKDGIKIVTGNRECVIGQISVWSEDAVSQNRRVAYVVNRFQAVSKPASGMRE